MVLSINDIFILFVLLFFGLTLGSFVNALVWRIHKQQKVKTKRQKEKYSMSRGRSMCVHCEHELAARDLVPVLSWIFLKGRCRYCKKPISWQYPLVELATALLFIVSYLFWPGFQGTTLEIGEIVNFVVWLLCIVGFVALVVYDLRWMLLPNRIIFPLIALAGANALIQALMAQSFEPVSSALIGALIGGGIFYLLFQISSGRWIGGGDVKLGFLIGILVGGPTLALLMLFTASFLGSLYSVPKVMFGKISAKTRVAFGPFLIAAGIIVGLFGQKIVDWYISYFLL